MNSAYKPDTCCHEYGEVVASTAMYHFQATGCYAMTPGIRVSFILVSSERRRMIKEVLAA